jgi:hypothetical protein
VCESDGVQLRPAVDVLVVPYSVRLTWSVPQYGIPRCGTEHVMSM